MCFYTVVLILWYGTCFEVGMNLCMDKISFMISILSLGSYVSLFMVDIWYISSMYDKWCVCILMYNYFTTYFGG